MTPSPTGPGPEMCMSWAFQQLRINPIHDNDDDGIDDDDADDDSDDDDDDDADDDGIDDEGRILIMRPVVRIWLSQVGDN